MKNYVKYYTPEIICKKLLGFIKFHKNCKVVDICCGNCNFLKSAKIQEPTLDCYGSDLIDVNEENVKTYKKDGRAMTIDNLNYFDYALANPPFEKTKEIQYSKILFTNEYSEINSRRLEVEMLVANLRILNKKGTLLIIMPETFVYGISYKKIRSIVAKLHTIEYIIDLPVNVFYPEKIKTVALIINKEKRETVSKYSKLDENLDVIKNTDIEQKTIESGDWFFSKAESNFDWNIKRGNISSNKFAKEGIEVLHTSKLKKNWYPSIRFVSKTEINKSSIMAEHGDVLISRVGVSAGKYCIYKGKPRYISDCVLIIKKPDNLLLNIISKLELRSIVKGLATPHITVFDINMRIAEFYKTHL